MRRSAIKKTRRSKRGGTKLNEGDYAIYPVYNFWSHGIPWCSYKDLNFHYCTRLGLTHHKWYRPTENAVDLTCSGCGKSMSDIHLDGDAEPSRPYNNPNGTR